MDTTITRCEAPATSPVAAAPRASVAHETIASFGECEIVADSVGPVAFKLACDRDTYMRLCAALAPLGLWVNYTDSLFGGTCYVWL